ncbi:hypothetical protein HYT05_02890 [Candidatus Kaiserbacteria bacterium]|nr:hypothetical protein [Candidatus Kaiserbacteria bacterium]
MLTDQDIDRLMKVFPTKDEVHSIVQGELVEVKETQQQVLNALDRVATAIENNNLENAVTDTKIARHDRWIHELADNNQVKLVA